MITGCIIFVFPLLWEAIEVLPKIRYNQKKLPVILPPIHEQKLIAFFLDQEIRTINAKIDKTKKIIALQKEYRTALISEVVTGKIKVTEEAIS